MTSDLNVWMNNQFVPWKSATVPILSHGFSRASAIFEIFRIHKGPDGPAAFRMDEHLKRLMNSARLLQMDMAYSMDEIAEAVRKTVKLNHMEQGVIKILAYWGEEAVIQLVLESKLDLAVFAIPDSSQFHMDKKEPISACISKWRKIHPETVQVEAKACANYLNGYLARKDALDRGYDTGIMLGTDGFVAEGSTESLFLVKDGILKVPPLGRVLSSITRMTVKEIANHLNIAVVETTLFPDDLYQADELFVSYTGTKVSPISRFEDRLLDAPGPVTRRIKEKMDDVLAFKDETFRRWFQKIDNRSATLIDKEKRE
jgi:branched-chain amino acid aminotransferase